MYLEKNIQSEFKRFPKAENIFLFAINNKKKKFYYSYCMARMEY